MTASTSLPARRHAAPLFGTSLPGAQSAAWALAALVLALMLQFHLVITRAVNWDEFWYYSQVQQHARGGLALPLQTIHVQLFGWLTRLPGNGVDHIVAGRLGMFAAELVTLAAIAGICSHFTDRRTGLFCALAYLTSIYAFQHGFAFRVDPLAASLSMASLYVLLTSPLRWRGVLAFALLLGLAGMVTIKTALYAPAFAGVAWLRLAESRAIKRTLATLAACGLGALAVFGVLYVGHAASLGEAELRAGAGTVGGAAGYVLQLGAPAYHYYIIHAVRSPLLTMIILAAPVAIALSGLARARKVALVGMAATGLCIFYYVNTLAYFYAFILPPMICGACLVVDWAVRRYRSLTVAAIMAACVLVLWFREPESPIAKQRTLLDAAEEIFPEPVAYFDFCGMLGTFDKANGFMTTWGIANYLQRGEPAFRQRMERETVPLVFAGEQQTYLTFEELLTTKGPSRYFMAEDATVLRGNYVRFWGPYWLAGKAVAPGSVVAQEEFLVPGPYTVHDSPIVINGVTHQPGDVVRLDRGFHSVRNPGKTAARLLWGERLKPPAGPPPAREWWIDF